MMIEIKSDNAMKALIAHKRCLHELDKALRLIDSVNAGQEMLDEIDATFSLSAAEKNELIKKTQNNIIKLGDEILIKIGLIIKSATEVVEAQE